MTFSDSKIFYMFTKAGDLKNTLTNKVSVFFNDTFIRKVIWLSK